MQTGSGHLHRAAHKTGGGAEGGGHRDIQRTEKSNAYFGKSLVRLACNQEKKKEKKSDRTK